MKIYFRELKSDDIPAIREICKDIWEGHDYVPHVIEEWLDDKDSLNYGAFIDESKKELVAFNRVKLYNNELAWFEGGRVKLSYQKQGIGKKLANYGINHANKLNVKIAQYATSSKNLGSISVAKHFGFKSKKSMNVLDAERKDIKLKGDQSLIVEKVSAKEAIKRYKDFDITAEDEVCMGWTFVPLKYISDEDGEWYISNSDAILQKVKFRREKIKEGPREDEIWLIIYGKTKLAIRLIQYIIQEELKSIESKFFEIFCHPHIAQEVKKIGFSYYEGEPFGVVLFEKILNE
ncbi:MAG: GNAT family N-acetyltransferase [Candidatus Hodarchaeota archaeon]